MKFVNLQKSISIRKLFFFIAIATVYIIYRIYQSNFHLEILNRTPSNWNYFLLEEINFPIAFGISVYRDVEQFQHLFKAIYRPFNVYCIHVDLKSDDNVRQFVEQLTRKYRNVILPKRFINVVHSKFSVLESELLCMEALYQYKNIKWKYFINLTGQEWPLKTNLELVRILKELKGANLIEKIKVNPDRIPKNIGPPPHGLHLWKGAVHIIVVKNFVKFALKDKRALDLLQYLEKTLVPDETYFSTLNHEHRLKAPGGYSGDLERDPIKYPFLNRYKIWETEGDCHGTFVRGICIFSMLDVPPIIHVNNKKLFINKFIKDINIDVFNYIEKWWYNRTNIVYSNVKRNPFINLTYYSQLEVVKNHY